MTGSSCTPYTLMSVDNGIRSAGTASRRFGQPVEERAQRDLHLQPAPGSGRGTGGCRSRRRRWRWRVRRSSRSGSSVRARGRGWRGRAATPSPALIVRRRTRCPATRPSAPGDRQVAQQLLDRRRHRGRVVTELGQLLRVLSRANRAQGDHVGRGLVAGDQQHHADRASSTSSSRPSAGCSAMSSSSRPSPGSSIFFCTSSCRYVNRCGWPLPSASRRRRDCVLEERVVLVGHARAARRSPWRAPAARTPRQVGRRPGGDHRVQQVVDDPLDPRLAARASAVR